MQDDTNFLIYKLTCSTTNKHYVGQTSDLPNRLLSHQSPSSGCIALRNAIQKYGWDSFSLEHKQKISASRIGQVQEMVQCEFCLTTGRKGPMMRWHFNNCKYKVITEK